MFGILFGIEMIVLFGMLNHKIIKLNTDKIILFGIEIKLIEKSKLIVKRTKLIDKNTKLINKTTN